MTQTNGGYQLKMTEAGKANRRAADRARRRALSRMLAAFRDEAHALVPPGQRGNWENNHRAARIIRDRHPNVWRRVLAEERSKEQIVPLPMGRPKVSA